MTKRSESRTACLIRLEPRGSPQQMFQRVRVRRAESRAPVHRADSEVDLPPGFWGHAMPTHIIRECGMPGQVVLARGGEAPRERELEVQIPGFKGEAGSR